MKKTCVLFGAGADIPFGISGGKNFALKVLGFDANDMNSAIKEYFRSELPNFEHKTWYPPYEQTTWKEKDIVEAAVYEDNVSGRITDERYDKMAQNYETDQSTLTKKLAELEEAEASYGSERNSIDDFIANANRFIDIQELTPEIVHAFIFKIYVYEKKEKWSRTEGNDIDIVFTVGFREQHTVRTSDALAS